MIIVGSLLRKFHKIIINTQFSLIDYAFKLRKRSRVVLLNAVRRMFNLTRNFRKSFLNKPHNIVAFPVMASVQFAKNHFHLADEKLFTFQHL